MLINAASSSWLLCGIADADQNRPDDRCATTEDEKMRENNNNNNKKTLTTERDDRIGMSIFLRVKARKENT